MPFIAGDEGSKCVSMTWRAISGRPQPHTEQNLRGAARTDGAAAADRYVGISLGTRS